MEKEDALLALSALAHKGRLAVFRLLVKAGPEGLAAGTIARRLKAAPNTMSAQLLILSNAGLIGSRRDGRSIIYAVKFKVMGALLLFLTKDFCVGRPEFCAPLAAVTGCRPPKTRRA